VIPLKIMHPDTDAAAAALAFAVPPMVVAPGEDRMDVPFIVSNVTLVDVESYDDDDVSKYDLVPGEVRTATIPFPILDWGMGVLVSDPVESMIVVDALTLLFVRQSNSARAADVMRAILC